MARTVRVHRIAERLFAHYLINPPVESFPPMSNNSSSFRIGQRVALSYNYVHPNRHLGQIVAVSPKSVHVHIEGECRAARIFLARNGKLAQRVWPERLDPGSMNQLWRARAMFTAGRRGN